MSEDVNLIVVDGAYGIATWNRLVIVNWWGDPTLARHTALLKAFREFAEASALSVGCHSIIEPTASMPSNQANQEAGKVFRQTASEGKLAGLCAVIGGDGVRVSLTNVMLTVVQVITRARYPRAHFRSTDQAANWWAQQLAITPSEIREGLRAARDAITTERARLAA